MDLMGKLVGFELSGLSISSRLTRVFFLPYSMRSAYFYYFLKE
jgi:hypothetical protein